MDVSTGHTVLQSTHVSSPTVEPRTFYVQTISVTPIVSQKVIFTPLCSSPPIREAFAPMQWLTSHPLRFAPATFELDKENDSGEQSGSHTLLCPLTLLVALRPYCWSTGVSFRTEPMNIQSPVCCRPSHDPHYGDRCLLPGHSVRLWHLLALMEQLARLATFSTAGLGEAWWRLLRDTEGRISSKLQIFTETNNSTMYVQSTQPLFFNHRLNSRKGCVWKSSIC